MSFVEAAPLFIWVDGPVLKDGEDSAQLFDVHFSDAFLRKVVDGRIVSLFFVDEEDGDDVGVVDGLRVVDLDYYEAQ